MCCAKWVRGELTVRQTVLWGIERAVPASARGGGKHQSLCFLTAPKNYENSRRVEQLRTSCEMELSARQQCPSNTMHSLQSHRSRDADQPLSTREHMPTACQPAAEAAPSWHGLATPQPCNTNACAAASQTPMAFTTTRGCRHVESAGKVAGT
jgi:hypothetical protein